MGSHEIKGASVIADEQSAKFIYPGEGAFSTKATFVDFRVKAAFWARFRTGAISRVEGDIGNKAIVETNLTGGAGIKGSIGIEECVCDRDAQTFERLEGRFEMGRHLPGIVMIAGDDISGGDDKAVAVGDGQDVGGFGTLASLIGNPITTLLGNGVAAVKIQIGGIQAVSDHVNTLLPQPFQTAIATPFAKVVVYGRPTDFFFWGFFGSGSIGSFAH